MTSVAAGIVRLEAAVESPLSGWVTDRFGPRWIVVSGVLIMSLGLILIYFIESLWAFYAAWGVVFGTGFVIAVHLPMDTAISNWFVKKRGTALSVKMVFSGLSGGPGDATNRLADWSARLESCLSCRWVGDGTGWPANDMVLRKAAQT